MTFIVKASIFLVLPFLVFGEYESFKGKTLVVTTVESRPYLMLKSDHENFTGNGKYRGYLVDLLKSLSKLLKCKFEIKLVDDGKYGQYDGSNWNGMIGEVISGTADMALADITITAMREKHVDFSHPFMHLGITVLYHKSSRQSRRIYTVEDFLDHKDIKLGVYGFGSSKKFFENSDIYTYQRIYEYMESDPTVYTNSNREGIERVKDEAGAYAYFIESSSAEYITNRVCDLRIVGGNLDSRSYGIVLQKGSPYRKDLNVALLTLMEEGTLSKLKFKWWEQKDGGGACSKEDSEFIYQSENERGWMQFLFDFLPEF